MSILKLLPGQKIHLTVVTTSLVEGNYGPQIKFSGFTADDNDAAIFLNVDTAEQQLARIGLTVETAKGQQVEIERIEKNGRKFTNINRVGVDFTKLHRETGAIADARVTAETLDRGRSVKQPYSARPHIPAIDGEHPALPHEKLDMICAASKAFLGHVLSTEIPELVKAQIGASDTYVHARVANLLITAEKAGVFR